MRRSGPGTGSSGGSGGGRARVSAARTELRVPQPLRGTGERPLRGAGCGEAAGLRAPRCRPKRGSLGSAARLGAAMWSVLWSAVRTHAPYVTFPVAFVVGAVGYHLEWFIRGPSPPPAEEEEKSISERREDRKLQEIAGKDLTEVVSLKEKLEFAPRAVLNRNRPEKS